MSTEALRAALAELVRIYDKPAAGEDWGYAMVGAMAKARAVLALPSDAAIAKARAALAQPSSNPWRDTVDDMLTVCGGVASDDPRESINRLINWNVEVALDPCVSSDAQALIDRGKAMAQLNPEPFGYVVEHTHGLIEFVKEYPYLDTAVSCTPVYTSSYSTYDIGENNETRR